MAERLHVVRRSVEARVVEQGRRRHARPERELLGRRAEARQGRLPVRSPTPPPSSRPSRPARSTRSTRSRRSTSSRRSRPASRASPRTAAETGNFEALWINNAKAPFDSVAVRQAFAYSLDRDAIVEALFGGLGVSEPLNVAQRADPVLLHRHRGLRRLHARPRQGRRADDRRRLGQERRRHLGEGRRDGRASIFTTTAGNERRELTEQILQEQAEAAGFDVTIENQRRRRLLRPAPARTATSRWASTPRCSPSLAPGTCNLFCSKNIPTAANDNSRPELDPDQHPRGRRRCSRSVDTNLDEDARAEAGKAGRRDPRRERAVAPARPAAEHPRLERQGRSARSSDNPMLGPFWNINQLGRRQLS